jgi:galactokinase
MPWPDPFDHKLDRSLSVPGRINLIGEHIDYHRLPVLPMAIQRRIRIEYRRRDDRLIRAASQNQRELREIVWTDTLYPASPGDWTNYVMAAAQAVAGRWDAPNGIDAVVDSDLPAAAGLSSSTALLTAFTLALLEANGIRASLDELMEVLPEGEHFVGTRGGGMDHAAVLGSQAGHALLVHFAPFSAEPVAIPPHWRFLVAHSLVTASKSGAARGAYNSVLAFGLLALERLGFQSYADALAQPEQIPTLAGRLPGRERDAFLHVTGEALRVGEAVRRLRDNDIQGFGALLLESHRSLRDQLQVSCPELDELVAIATESGAYGARLTGAGFGGCAIVLCDESSGERVREQLAARFYAPRGESFLDGKLFFAEPAAGALA